MLSGDATSSRTLPCARSRQAEGFPPLRSGEGPDLLYVAVMVRKHECCGRREGGVIVNKVNKVERRHSQRERYSEGEVPCRLPLGATWQAESRSGSCSLGWARYSTLCGLACLRPDQ